MCEGIVSRPNDLSFLKVFDGEDGDYEQRQCYLLMQRATAFPTTGVLEAYEAKAAVGGAGKSRSILRPYGRTT